MADRLPWFRCFPSALLGALAGLDPDEGLTYVTALLRIYETGGPVGETGKTLSRRTGLPERKASAALERLIEAGKLLRTADGRIDSATTHDEIRWQTERRTDQSAAGKASAARRQKQAVEEKNVASIKSDDQNDGQKDQRNQQNGSTPVERPFNHLDLEPEEEKEGDKLLPFVGDRGGFPPKAFELWWIGYPHKVGKQAAEKAFERVRRSGRVPWAALTDGVQRYIRTKPPDRSYCNPATWLNEGRWDDEPSVGNSGSLVAGFAPGRGRQPAGNSAVATALARHANRSGIGPGIRADGPRSDDQGRHRPGRDDPEVEDADWSPAGGYRAAH
ncbi:hypothetical protein [Methylobacterium sp. Leaf108]|uniref:hypothetical protein n=1 Tax=Methylobacterium sp. Leaf108 TaxID=1736256 RepID=UPI000A980D49|nr:hypothetical protein [Methylobacterium sp. Leaf108]